MSQNTCRWRPQQRYAPVFWKFVLVALCFCFPIKPSESFQRLDPSNRKMEEVRRTNQIAIPKPLPSQPNASSYVSLQMPKDSTAIRAGAASLLVLAVVLGLAIKDSQNLASNDVAINAVENVIDAAMPSSSTDLVASALGESIGGICGAAATVGLTSLINLASNNTKSTRKSDVANAIADSDYFIVNSASMPLLTAFGLPPALASVGSVVFASIPSQLVKLGQREKERLIEEESMLSKLLYEQQLVLKQKRPARFRFPTPFAKPDEPKVTVVQDLTPVTTEHSSIDPVEIFADVIRWLEYGVLKADLDGTLVINDMVLDPGQTGAVLGIFAAVSSQFYADVLYGRLFEYGPKSKQEEVALRSTSDWIKVYTSKAASSAALFGVFEASQIPIGRWIQGTLAGGVDGCIGSSSFDICLQTYIDSNSPGPSPEAQVRALVTNLVMVRQRLVDIAGDTTWDDVQRLLKAWMVSMNSYFHHL